MLAPEARVDVAGGGDRSSSRQYNYVTAREIGRYGKNILVHNSITYTQPAVASTRKSRVLSKTDQRALPMEAEDRSHLASLCRSTSVTMPAGVVDVGGDGTTGLGVENATG